jgi:hypothetical protein
MSDFSTDFMQGQRDCREGIPHQSGKGEAYDRGYAYQYEAEQLMTELGLQQDKCMGVMA